MLFRTHLVIGVFALVLFLPLVEAPIWFGVTLIIGTMFPDIDNSFSKVGRNFFSKFVQATTSHRGIIHSLTFCLVLSLVLAFFIPVLAFGFFLGYSLHLIGDSFTKRGIKPFWPWKKTAQGFLITGGVVEKGIFLVFFDYRFCFNCS
jgi:membrane-bound metal-dependent hydrolase YbcI (DUF457 family)